MLNLHIPQEETDLRPRITVIGCGGGGSNAVNNMIQSGLQGVEFLVCNSDAQSLKMSLADRKIQLGLNVTRGLGAGARPDVGRAAADEALDEIMGYLEGSNMVFITAGMGGGTGTGGAPVIARAAKEAGILTVGVVTKPFHFEGAHRMRLAEAGIEELQQHVDTLLIIPNQNLFRVANEKTTFADAFKMADEVLHAGVRGVTDLMVMPGLINLDFADIRAVMSEMGKAMMGTGEAEGERRAIEAAEAAINNPLLEDASMAGARGLLINITGGMDMTLYEVDEACNRIRDEVDPDANIIFGSTFSPELDGKIRVSVVATGIDNGMRAYKTPGQLGGFAAPEAPQPLAAQFAAQSKQPAAMQTNPFTRGVTLRQGSGMGPAGTPNTANTQSPLQQPRQTGTAGTNNGGNNTMMSANPMTPRAAAMASNPGFFARAASAASAAALRIEEPMTIGELEADTAEDVFSSYDAGMDEMEVAPAPAAMAPAARHNAPVQQRGERDGDSFIPPAPVMTEAKPVSATASAAPQQQYAPQQQQPQAPMTASRSAGDLFVEAAPQMQQRAPQPQAPIAAPQEQAPPIAAQPQQQQQQAKRPGLFDRLTGGSRQQAAPAAAPAQPQQPTLTVDNSDRMPAASGFDDDLEIPAFLRRQAN